MMWRSAKLRVVFPVAALVMFTAGSVIAEQWMDDCINDCIDVALEWVGYEGNNQVADEIFEMCISMRCGINY